MGPRWACLAQEQRRGFREQHTGFRTAVLGARTVCVAGMEQRQSGSWACVGRAVEHCSRKWQPHPCVLGAPDIRLCLHPGWRFKQVARTLPQSLRKLAVIVIRRFS
jgi:hypothetical protein